MYPHQILKHKALLLMIDKTLSSESLSSSCLTKIAYLLVSNFPFSTTLGHYCSTLRVNLTILGYFIYVKS
jgi:hypothetical protein